MQVLLDFSELLTGILQQKSTSSDAKVAEAQGWCEHLPSAPATPWLQPKRGGMLTMESNLLLLAQLSPAKHAQFRHECLELS